MSTVWVTVIALALATAALKLVGPLFLGGRTMPPRVMSVIELLAAALLAALVIVETFGDGRSLVIDERVPGVIFAGIALRRGAPVIVAVVGAAVVAALWRAVF
jgi:uncharacterized membrane protein